MKNKLWIVFWFVIVALAIIVTITTPLVPMVEQGVRRVVAPLQAKLYFAGMEPDPMGRFELHGEIADVRQAEILTCKYGFCDERFNSVAFSMDMSRHQREWLERMYPVKVGTTVASNSQSDIERYSRASTGNWCGDLPPMGTKVAIFSPTGYTKDVWILDTDTGRKYTSSGECELPKALYHFRVIEKTSGGIVDRGDSWAWGWVPVKFEQQAYYPSDRYLVQVWPDGDQPPDYKPTAN